MIAILDLAGPFGLGVVVAILMTLLATTAFGLARAFGVEPAPVPLALSAGIIAASALALAPSPLDTGFGLALGAGLLGLATIDAAVRRLPDAITFPGIGLGLIKAALLAEPSFADAMIGAIAGYAIFALVSEVYFRFRNRDGLGLGDAKLLAMAGAWLGWRSLPLVILLACLAALAFVCLQVARKREMTHTTALPFGPFLVAALWVGQINAWRLTS